MKITLPEWINAKKNDEEEKSYKDIEQQLEGAKFLNQQLLEDNFELLTENRRLKEENKDIKFYAMCGGICVTLLVIADLITSISLVDLITR
nr:MAG TPA: hypothetical protein [Caudoviricetes sp.]